jgi:zeaxanthin glucosyltransferase
MENGAGMSHIGVFSPAAPGHINPMSCLGRALQARGHRVTYFQIRDCEEKIRATGLNYAPIAEREFPRGSLAAMYEHLGALHGLSALRYVVAWFAREAAVLLDEVPGVLRAAGVDLVLVDQATLAAASAAEHARVPFVVVSNALVLNREPGIPPFFTTWPYSTSLPARLRNHFAETLVERLARPWTGAINRQRQKWGLAPFRRDVNQPFPYAHISQQPACFDFPRRTMPANFHYTGPFHDVRVRPPAPFPWERLTGRPLIYASMGTLQNRLRHVFHTIAEACRGLDADLVISLGGGASPEHIGPLPGDPIVIGFAPQLELLARASLTITHAGLNTALETLAAGVPAVAIPVGNDQPGVAARLKWVGAGEVLGIRQLRADRLRPLVHKVLTEPRYRERACAMQAKIRKIDGIAHAVDIVERVG